MYYDVPAPFLAVFFSCRFWFKSQRHVEGHLATFSACSD